MKAILIAIAIGALLAVCAAQLVVSMGWLPNAG